MEEKQPELDVPAMSELFDLEAISEDLLKRDDRFLFVNVRREDRMLFKLRFEVLTTVGYRKEGCHFIRLIVHETDGFVGGEEIVAQACEERTKAIANLLVKGIQRINACVHATIANLQLMPISSTKAQKMFAEIALHSP